MSRRILVIGVLALASSLTFQAQQAGGGGQPGTSWTESRLREVVDVARVGRKLTPRVWPNRAKVAVCLSFDTDTEAPLPLCEPLPSLAVPPASTRMRLCE